MWLENQVGLIIQIKEIKMTKKILLITCVIFLSSCASTNIQELGDKFLDLINPSDAPAEVTDLSEQILVLSDESGGFTEEELETLSNDELIAIAKEKGLEDILVLDADGNLQNRDEVIKALVESEALKEGATQELESLSNDALVEIAQAKGMEDKIILDEDGNLQNRNELLQEFIAKLSTEKSAAAASTAAYQAKVAYDARVAKIKEDLVRQLEEVVEPDDYKSHLVEELIAQATAKLEEEKFIGAISGEIVTAAIHEFCKDTLNLSDSNIALFKKALAGGYLGNVGPQVKYGTEFTANRWDKYITCVGSLGN